MFLRNMLTYAETKLCVPGFRKSALLHVRHDCIKKTKSNGGKDEENKHA